MKGALTAHDYCNSTEVLRSALMFVPVMASGRAELRFNLRTVLNLAVEHMQMVNLKYIITNTTDVPAEV